MVRLDARFIAALPDGVKDVKLSLYGSQVIVATDKGVFIYDEGQWTSLNSLPSPPSIFRTKIEGDFSNGLVDHNNNK